MKLAHLTVWILLGTSLCGTALRQVIGQESLQNVEWREFEGKRFISSASLKQAGVEVKNLPGERKLALCTSNRCTLISDFVREERAVWLGSLALESAGVRLIEANGTWQIKIEA